MSELNLEELNKAFIKLGAYLARDMDWDVELTPIRVDRWRDSTMQIIQWNKYLITEVRQLRNTRSNWISVDALIPKLHEMLKDEVVVAGCVSFDTIREAIKQLKASPPGEE